MLGDGCLTGSVATDPKRLPLGAIIPAKMANLQELPNFMVLAAQRTSPANISLGSTLQMSGTT